MWARPLAIYWTAHFFIRPLSLTSTGSNSTHATVQAPHRCKAHDAYRDPLLSSDKMAVIICYFPIR
jgi:hypothetical protein